MARQAPEALDAYGAGDDAAVERWLSSPGAVSVLRDVVARFRSRQQPWSRETAAFLLEIAVLQPVRASELLAVGRSMVVSRPKPLGADPVEDCFELLWHQVAFSIAQSLPHVGLQREYLDSVSVRFDDARARGVVLETRFPLARAVLAATACCWKPGSGQV